MRSILALCALLLAAFFGYFWFAREIPRAPSAPPASSTPVAFHEIGGGDTSAITERHNYLITSKDELAELWQLTDARGPLPAVDFKKQDVIAVFAGQEPTAGYAIAVASVRDAPRARVVAVTITEPGATCLLAPAPTSPYELLVLAKSSLPYTHQDTAATVGCLP